MSPRPEPRRKPRSRKSLIITAVTIAALSFVFDKIVGGSLDRRVDRLTTAENLFRTETGTENNALEIAAFQAQLNQQQAALRLSEKNDDFSVTISVDIPVLQSCNGQMKIAFDDLSRLTDALPYVSEQTRSTLMQIKTQVDLIDAEVRPLIKPPASHDWATAAFIKLELIKVLIEDILIAAEQDSMLTSVQTVRQATETLVEWVRWLTYCLYAASLGIGLYAKLSGVELVEEP
jgi:hypothetical protein